MRVSVIINPKAGSVHPEKIKEMVSKALFRCDLCFHISMSMESLELFIKDELFNKGTHYFVVCGGDGTINLILQILINLAIPTQDLPALCVIRSGTANDLAHEMGISNRIDRAARQILEGKIKKIDVLEVSSPKDQDDHGLSQKDQSKSQKNQSKSQKDQGKKKYMLTNGGLGIPAVTAAEANNIRSLLQKFSIDGEQSLTLKLLSSVSYRIVKKMGSSLYAILLIESILRWQQKNWFLEIEIPGKSLLNSQAPFVLVNNQSTLGNKFKTAPHTVNDDGQVNLLLIDGPTISERLKALLLVARGKLNDSPTLKSYEVPEFVIRVTGENQGLTFFGDGEILFENVPEIQVRCLRKKMYLVVNDQSESE